MKVHSPIPNLLKQLLALSLLVLLLPVTTSAENIVTQVAAVVNNHAITTLQLEKELKPLLAEVERKNGPLSSVDREALKRNTLDQMVEQELIRQQAESIGIRVTKEELDTAIDDVLNQNKINIDQLETALGNEGIELSDYRETLEMQIIRMKVVNREVRSKIDVTAHEVRNYYEEHKEEYRQDATLSLSRISLDPSLAADKDALSKLIANARTSLARGDSLDAVAAIFPEEWQVDAIDMGAVEADGLSPLFADAIAGLAVGAASEVIELGNMIHILRVEDKNGSNYTPLTEVEDEINRKLLDINSEKRFSEWRDKLREKAFVEIKI